MASLARSGSRECSITTSKKSSEKSNRTGLDSHTAPSTGSPTGTAHLLIDQGLESRRSSRRSPPPAPTTVGGPGLTNDQIQHLCDYMLYDELYHYQNYYEVEPLPLHSQPGTNSLTSQEIIELRDYMFCPELTHDNQTPLPPNAAPGEVQKPIHPLPAFATSEETSSAGSLTDSATPRSRSRNQSTFQCMRCGKMHDRPERARDCAYQDRRQTPYKCTGACGKAGCAVEFSFEERLRRHLRPRIRCPFCPALVYYQNVARHREMHSIILEESGQLPEL